MALDTEPKQLNLYRNSTDITVISGINNHNYDIKFDMQPYFEYELNTTAITFN